MKCFKFLVNLSRLLYLFSLILLCLYTTIAFINVIARYVFFKPYAWTEEITTFFFVLGVYLCQVNLEASNKQLSISFVAAKIKNKALLNILYVLKQVFIAAIFLLLIKEAIPVIERNYLFDTSTVILRIPMWPLYTVVAFIMLFVVFINMEKLLALFLRKGSDNGIVAVGQMNGKREQGAG